MTIGVAGGILVAVGILWGFTQWQKRQRFLNCQEKTRIHGEFVDKTAKMAIDGGTSMTQEELQKFYEDSKRAGDEMLDACSHL